MNERAIHQSSSPSSAIGLSHALSGIHAMLSVLPTGGAHYIRGNFRTFAILPLE